MPPAIASIIDTFIRISAIPRCSRNETAIAEWMHRWADARGLTVVSDAAGNMVIQVPASPNAAAAPTVVVQGHLDMVCEKRPSSSHDFSTDPLQVRTDGDWLRAKDTSLGADNGIALAYALALVDDYTGPRPPLELLFTVDEETGLNGAKALDPRLITGRRMLNIDSEQAGELTIGCAGGLDLILTRPVMPALVDAGNRCFRIAVAGGRGGHSGIDIHRHRANANRILARALTAVSTVADMRIITIAGGSAHNAIPREAQATVAVAPDAVDDVMTAIDTLAAAVADEYRLSDPVVTLRIEPGDHAGSIKALSHADSTCLTAVLMAIPTGPVAFSVDADRVATSNNLATVALGPNQWRILSSLRSDGLSTLSALEARIRAIAHLGGAALETSDHYPPWPPNPESRLLALCQDVYQRTVGHPPRVCALHAGLECAVIGNLVPGMDMISFGPTIENPHSPDERMHIPSVEDVWAFLTALMAEMAKEV